MLNESDIKSCIDIISLKNIFKIYQTIMPLDILKIIVLLVLYVSLYLKIILEENFGLFLRSIQKISEITLALGQQE